jgi:hypothetical protein
MQHVNTLAASLGALALFLIVSQCKQSPPPPREGPDTVTFWYGPQQSFGRQGQAQRWINVLGQIGGAERVQRAYYILNNGNREPLTLGSDLHRLAWPGDFNVELSWDEVREGENELVVGAIYQDSSTVSETTTLVVEKGHTWPLPYTIDFSGLKTLQDTLQIVDGNWRLTPEGVHIDEPYYDRVLSLGDTTWTDYEALVELTIHDFMRPRRGAPTYNVTHFGVAMRWQGHHSDNLQPSRKWYPLGAQGELLIRSNLSQSQWRLLFDGGKPDKPIVYAEGRNELALGRRMRIRTQVETRPDGRTRYRFKQWWVDQQEPSDWDLEGFESNDYRGGSLCLVPHNSDVTIHSVEVKPLV